MTEKSNSETETIANGSCIVMGIDCPLPSIQFRSNGIEISAADASRLDVIALGIRELFLTGIVTPQECNTLMMRATQFIGRGLRENIGSVTQARPSSNMLN